MQHTDYNCDNCKRYIPNGKQHLVTIRIDGGYRVAQLDLCGECCKTFKNQISKLVELDFIGVDFK